MITNSPEETKELGRRLAEMLDGGENLLLVGDLGAGKTLFAQGLAEGLGVTEPVKSPTYTYLREYDLPNRSTRLAHFDLYRLPDRPTESELHSIELPERLADRDVITVIEWADKLADPQNGTCWTLEFAVSEDGKREISLPKALRRAAS
ncbi:MAG: tRNA (adenosine(37)-N6)-threonylcarbamoyltransferase complex ATPase subunit type 1 TsaE [bacterium]|nr:tRNA (adenosine(37)-N6)-threonylcarbamoyltransferase complex ATPase subunit type 1 TsaE [bacterium]MDZ4248226.1 tRNA (adenosine(37)-N6)-threonylcarbamoyltransferase complex ATPase subunit type 1 TsaE [Patescibacteria group bacterium]